MKTLCEQFLGKVKQFMSELYEGPTAMNSNIVQSKVGQHLQKILRAETLEDKLKEVNTFYQQLKGLRSSATDPELESKDYDDLSSLIEIVATIRSYILFSTKLAEYADTMTPGEKRQKDTPWLSKVNLTVDTLLSPDSIYNKHWDLLQAIPTNISVFNR